MIKHHCGNQRVGHGVSNKPGLTGSISQRPGVEKSETLQLYQSKERQFPATNKFVDCVCLAAVSLGEQ
jgi:hypothetical protein